MTRFTLRLMLHGTSRKPRPRSFDLGNIEDVSIADEVAEAVSRAGNIIAELVSVTSARAQTVKDISISMLNPSDVGNALIGVGTGDIFENALVNVYSINENDENDVLSLSQLYIPAPVPGIFQAADGPESDVVDPTDADLQAYVEALSENAFVSDGETIQLTSGTAGIANGRRVSTPVSKSK